MNDVGWAEAGSEVQMAHCKTVVNVVCLLADLASFIMTPQSLNVRVNV